MVTFLVKATLSLDLNEAEERQSPLNSKIEVPSSVEEDIFRGLNLLLVDKKNYAP
jgi:hypothetical protein